jgi:hypothetical protein
MYRSEAVEEGIVGFRGYFDDGVKVVLRRGVGGRKKGGGNG